MAPFHGSQIGNNFISLVNAIVRQSEVFDRFDQPSLGPGLPGLAQPPAESSAPPPLGGSTVGIKEQCSSPTRSTRRREPPRTTDT